jgi:hypothetical protein
MAENTTPQRRRVNVIGVLFALIFLAIASVGFTGDPWWLFTQATKWIVAGVIAVIGVSLLATALPGRQRNKVN